MGEAEGESAGHSEAVGSAGPALVMALRSSPRGQGDGVSVACEGCPKEMPQPGAHSAELFSHSSGGSSPWSPQGQQARSPAPWFVAAVILLRTHGPHSRRGLLIRTLMQGDSP